MFDVVESTGLVYSLVAEIDSQPDVRVNKTSGIDPVSFSCCSRIYFYYDQRLEMLLSSQYPVL